MRKEAIPGSVVSPGTASSPGQRQYTLCTGRIPGKRIALAAPDCISCSRNITIDAQDLLNAKGSYTGVCSVSWNHQQARPAPVHIVYWEDSWRKNSSGCSRLHLLVQELYHKCTGLAECERKLYR